jgi:hypothetical protein
LDFAQINFPKENYYVRIDELFVGLLLLRRDLLLERLLQALEFGA